MYLRTYSYRYAEEILQHPKYQGIYSELLNICANCPLPVYPGKSTRQTNKDIIQQIMNTYFFLRFQEYQWLPEPLATPMDNQDALRSDFRKEFRYQDGDGLTVQIEVEFGNVASSYRNYFKFQLSFSYNLTDICVLIVPSNKLANRIDTGVSNYEKVIREIPSAKLSVTVPTLVIGLFDEDMEGIPLAGWNVRDTVTQDLNVLKGSTNALKKAHNQIVRNYINIYGNQLLYTIDKE